MDVVFAVMPFADVGRPAMGVSLLQAEVRAAGFTSYIEYFNIDLAEQIGVESYQQVASGLPPDLLTGEWFFADDLFGDSIPDEDEYLQKVLFKALGPGHGLVDELRGARKQRGKYLDDCAGRIIAHNPRVVGFTTTFHQTCACLAVAKRLKQMANPPVIVFGGANCEGEMGWQMIQSFPWIDYVCCGEADISFPALLERLVRGGADDLLVPGVLKQGKSGSPARSEAIQDMNGLPVPDFDEYFARLRSSPLYDAVKGYLIIETARGCWWGAKHHCTFCGLNGDTMAFRSKTPERAFTEMEHLSRKYATKRIGCVDNILDMRYVDTLFPKLAESGLDLELFYEVKANLRYDQLVKLRKGGMREIQPGIESFSNEVLRLMDKGCTGFQNIQLMRWCEELGIEVAWNLLAGFPGESAAEYAKMAALVPLLTHLTPPCSCAQIRLDRFSPFHARGESYGFHKMRPARAYYFVFPLGRKELGRLAYFFDFDYEDDRHTNTYLEPVQQEVQRWWSARSAGDGKRPKLDARFTGGAVSITDTRAVASAASHELTGIAAAVLAKCDVATTLPALARLPGMAGKETAIQMALDDLKQRGIVVENDGQYLSLPVFRDRPPAPVHNQTHAYATVPQAPAAEPLFRLV
jgi:ribosomal peptide maturation radical SAM protein 1